MVLLRSLITHSRLMNAIFLEHPRTLPYGSYFVPYLSRCIRLPCHSAFQFDVEFKREH